MLLKNGIRNSKLDVKKVKSDFEQQTYEGYNIFDGELENGTYSSGNSTYSSNNKRTKNFIEIEENTNYVFSLNGNPYKVVLNFYDSDKQWIDASDNIQGTINYSGYFTTPANAKYLRFRSFADDFELFGSANLMVFKNISGIGNRPFEPYVGGIPSPNPDYPQEMKVVTGTTEVVISEDEETLSTQQIRLGEIELGEIGEYKDEIIKENGDYYLVKNIKKIPISSEYQWGYVGEINVAYAQGGFESDWKIGTSQIICKSDYYLGQPNTNASANLIDFHICFYYTHAQKRIYVKDSRFSRIADFISWLNSLETSPLIYYVLNEPTKTKITDTDLISDLNNLKLPEDIEDINNLTLTVSGNLAGKLEFSYQQRIII